MYVIHINGLQNMEGVDILMSKICYSCSVLCFKQHKSEECSAPTSKVEEKKTENFIGESLYLFNFPTEDTVPLEKLQLLGKFTAIELLT